MNDLFEEHKEWALKQAQIKYCRELPDRTLQGDYETAALLGLWEACKSFDADKGVKFKSFALHRIIGAIADWKRENTRIFTRYFTKVRLNEGVYVLSLDTADIIEDEQVPMFMGKDDLRFTSLEEQEEFHRILDLLTEKQRQYLEMHVCYFMKQKEIAEVFGVTESAICQCLRDAVKNMARIYGNRNNVRTKNPRNGKNKKEVVAKSS